MKINLPKKPKGGGGKQQQHWTIFCQVSVLVAYQLRCQLRCIHLGCLAEQRDDLVSWSLVVKFGNCYVRVLMSTCRQIDALENTKTDHTGFIIWHNTLHCTLWLWFHVHFWNGSTFGWMLLNLERSNFTDDTKTSSYENYCRALFWFWLKWNVSPLFLLVDFFLQLWV